jgi:hypothetical protein
MLQMPTGAVLVPLSAAYPAEMANGQVIVQIGDIPCDVELEIPLRLTLYAGEAGARLSIEGLVSYTSPAGNALSNPLNRVTVRFLPPSEFTLREGIIPPTAERVFKHLRAAQVISASRAMASSPQTSAQQAKIGLETLREYANLVGTQEAQSMLHAFDNDLRTMAASPAQAKQQVAAAFQVQRSAKDFTKNRQR